MQLHRFGVDPERSLKGAKKNSIFLIELSCRNKPESERSQLGAKSRKVSFFDSGFFRLRIFSQKSVDFLLFYWFLIEFRGPRGYSSPYPDQPRVREKKQFLTNISSVTQIKWAIRSPVSGATRISRADRSPVSRPTRIRCDDPNRGSLNNFLKGWGLTFFWPAWSAERLVPDQPSDWAQKLQLADEPDLVDPGSQANLWPAWPRTGWLADRVAPREQTRRGWLIRGASRKIGLKIKNLIYFINY